jgi:hypothetical protein
VTTTPKDPKLSSKFYDVLKFLALVILPALGALYFSLSQIWGLPKATEVVGTITVVDTFLGVVLKLSSSAYHNSDGAYDGVMNVETKADGSLKYDLALNGSAEALANQRAVSFKVQTPAETTLLE